MIQIKKNKGFTLVELLAVVAILLIISFLSIPAWVSFSDSVNLEDTAKLVEVKIKLAKNYSLNSLNNSNYGLHFETSTITLYTACTAGICSAYNAAEPTNQIFNLPDGMEIYSVVLDGSVSDLVFDRLTGTTVNDGTIGIRIAARPSKSKQIFINTHGQTGIGVAPASSEPLFTNARHVHFALGWNIQNATFLNLEWTNGLGAPLTASSIDTAAYFNADKSVFDWEGTTSVNGVSQTMRIHSWLDGGNTVLCVMRDQTETDNLEISFTDGVTKEIANYSNSGGVITVAPGALGGVMTIQ